MSTFVLRAATSGLLSVGVVLSWLAARQLRSAAPLHELAQTLDADLRFLRTRLDARQLLMWQLRAGLPCAVLALLDAVWLGASLALIIAIAPVQVIARLRARRVTQLETQLDGFLLALANALRATPSLGLALAATALLAPQPLSDELDQLLKEYQLGLGLDQALEHAAQRIRSRSVSAAFLTLRLSREAGGQASACLESSAAALREMARLDGVVRTKTAEGKSQAWVIAVVPVPLFGSLNAIDSNLFAPLTASTAGYGVLLIAGGLWLAAVLLAQRIVQVDV